MTTRNGGPRYPCSAAILRKNTAAMSSEMPAIAANRRTPMRLSQSKDLEGSGGGAAGGLPGGTAEGGAGGTATEAAAGRTGSAAGLVTEGAVGAGDGLWIGGDATLGGGVMTRAGTG